MTVRDFPDGFFKCGVAAVNITEYMNFFVVGEINRTDIDKGVGIHKKLVIHCIAVLCSSYVFRYAGVL